ncbi:DUF1566 domain-containing protein [Variovorax sp. W2I14]|uniref:Lcl domain-containing protein n=1 Tax=Variovorax sp. W2I14 TaxID=3042290 RepID=UPI003D20A1A8
MSKPRPQLVIRIGEALYGLQVAPKTPGECISAWSPDNAVVAGATSCFDGLGNTRAMADVGIKVALWATGLEIDGHKDWYIPSRDELELLYRHYKPTTETNYVYRAGDNPSSVPAGYPYTASLPAQTGIDGFRAGAPDAFDDAWYWSSTQFSRYAAWFQGFGYGYQGSHGKSYEGRVRAVRRFLIE